MYLCMGQAVNDKTIPFLLVYYCPYIRSISSTKISRKKKLQGLT